MTLDELNARIAVCKAELRALYDKRRPLITKSWEQRYAKMDSIEVERYRKRQALGKLIHEQLNEGKTQRAVALELGISLSTLRQKLSQYGNPHVAPSELARGRAELRNEWIQREAQAAVEEREWREQQNKTGLISFSS